jgi:hypothetical protein
VLAPIISVLWTSQVRAATATTSTTAPITVQLKGSSVNGSAQAWITVVGVIVAAGLSTVAATLAARFGLKGSLASAEAAYRSALETAESQLAVAMTAATAQQEAIGQQLRQQSASEQAARLDQLADHRRKRQEDTILALQDALVELSVVVRGFARARAAEPVTRHWTRPADWDERLDRCSVEAFKLLQRLPRGSQPESLEDETWERVRLAIEDLCEKVIRSRSPADQAEKLIDFDAGIGAAQDVLGEALDRLDEQLLSSIERRRSELGAWPDQTATRPAPGPQPRPAPGRQQRPARASGRAGWPGSR